VLVVGEKEETAKTVNFRTRGSDGKTAEMKVDEFIEKLKKETEEKKL
jgi:threonyl-tRNA synthetase